MPDAANLKILISRSARTLELREHENPTHRFAVVLGRNAAADKVAEGDLATPLGQFFICAKNPRSKFFLSVCLSYPNQQHAERGLRDGLIDAAEHRAITDALRARKMPPQYTRLGGEIYIHGRATDDLAATRGCIALYNPDMQTVYDRVTIGTAVTIED